MSIHGYIAPVNLKEAIHVLATTPSARILGGGQELLIGQKPSDGSYLLVDLVKISELAVIGTQSDGGVRLGAMATLAEIAANDLVQALSAAARVMGDAQLRNRATLGGHFASADPDADLLAVLLALDADLEIIGPQGLRTVSASEFILGPRQTILGPSEVLAFVSVPALAKRSAVAYERIVHPATLYALCGVAANLTLDPSLRVRACFIAVTGATEYPVRLRNTEKMLIGKQSGVQAISAAVALAQDGLVFRGDLFASAEYRSHLMRVLIERSLTAALAAAQEQVIGRVQAASAA